MAANPNPPVAIEPDPGDHDSGAAAIAAVPPARSRASAAPIALPLETSHPEIAQFVRFAIVGASGVVVNVSVFLSVLAIAALAAGGSPLHPLTTPSSGSHRAEVVANACGFALSVLWNFALNRRWTFRSRGAVATEMPRFVVVSLSAYAGQLAVFWIALTQMQLARPLAQLVAIVCVMPLNFAANKLWSFRDR